MSNFRQLIAALLCACGTVLPPSLAQANHSADGVWRDVAESAIARSSSATPRASRYRTLHFNRAALTELLTWAPMESELAMKQSQTVISLPRFDGSFSDFRIVESPVMAPELAARYPQIRTWLGQGISDPSATLRLDLSPKGLHAQVISWQGTELVDPYQAGDDRHYVAYRKGDLAVPGQRPVCLVSGEELPPDAPDFSKRGVAAKISSGATLRTHRLAMAATGEYTAFHGGTVIDGLAAIVTTVNRVNGIYERELSVRMQLVANNDQIIYTDGATDPYTNNNGGTMLGQNQTNLNSVIGTANYDIGHVVSTGGGGVASLRSVCSTSNKARGVTGLGSPVGDIFDVDYVAHEIGHQYGGNHTFNGSGGSCSGANRNASTAYEPGGGITIQAYAGICGGDDLQSNSEDYFHRVSLNEMLTFTTSGSGGNCGTTSATGNTPPMISTTAAFTIPQLTPFALSAVASDGDGDALTYLWEQFDLGAANPTGSLVDNGSRPIFRSFTPTSEPTRIFPSLRYILNNANVPPTTAPAQGTTSPNFFTGEILPSTNRNLNFRVTARDNRGGGGGTNEASTQLTVSTAAGPFAVTAPNSAVSWAAGSEQTIGWSVANTDAAPINTANVRISLSLDGGLSWPIELAASTPNTGNAQVTIPGDTPATTQGRIRVAAEGNVFFDISDANLTISGSNTPPMVVVNGSISTRQGSPSVSGPVAVASDTQDTADLLTVISSGATPELTVSAANDNGTISLSATAACTLVAPNSGNRVYPLNLLISDTEGASTAVEVVVNVRANQVPTLGSYLDIRVGPGRSGSASPGAAPADGNDNLLGTNVSPSSLPGGGSIAIDPAGVVTVNVGAATPLGDYLIQAAVIDSCGATEMRRFTLTVTDALFSNGFE